MQRMGQTVFLLLVLAQGAHSIEEYITRLYAVFAPARFVSVRGIAWFWTIVEPGNGVSHSTLALLSGKRTRTG